MKQLERDEKGSSAGFYPEAYRAAECGESVTANKNLDPLLDAEAAARYLGLNGVMKHPAQAVRALCRKRRITHTLVGRRIMMRQSSLDEYLQENKRERFRP